MKKNAFKPSPAVMSQRKSPLKSLDFYPTPPWATRAFLKGILEPRYRGLSSQMCWEPAAGMGHMSAPLKETFLRTFESDVHDYGTGCVIGSFVGSGQDVIKWPFKDKPDWIITNPPFKLATEFLHRARHETYQGVALLVRTCWLESALRYNEIFECNPPTLIAQYAERVPMVQGRWDPGAASATAYCWIVWDVNLDHHMTEFVWIPPSAKTDYWRDEDVKKLAGLQAAV